MQKTAYELRISDCISDVCSSDLEGVDLDGLLGAPAGDPNDASTDMGAACTVAYGTGGSGGVSFAVTTSRSAENYDNQQELFCVAEELTGLGDKTFRSAGHPFVPAREILGRHPSLRPAHVGNPT